MRLFPCVAAVTLLSNAAPAAQDVPRRVSEAENIPVEEWSEMAMGRTLIYRIDGALWALERYHPGGNRVTLQYHDGSCQEGTWDYSAPHYCFYWEGDAPVCFRHARSRGEILIIETRNGADTNMLQQMTAVTDLPLACGPDLTS